MADAVPPPLVKPEVVFVEGLLDDISQGKLRVPRFQRPYVWRPADMVSLFDSIYKGYPIGSLLVWESAHPVMSSDEVGPLKIPPVAAGKTATYILDGHQRLATLFGGLRLPENARNGPDQTDWRWWIWFNLETENFNHVPHGSPEDSLLPVRALLRTTDFLKEARRIQEAFSGRKKAPNYIERAEALAAKFKNYKVAITRIVGGSLDEAVDIFSRLNTKGRSMTLDQMVSALTYRERSGGMNLAARIDRILERLSDWHFGNLKRLTVFRAIAAAAGQPIHKSEWESIARRLGDTLAVAVDNAEKSLIQAARFLREEVGLPNDELLPYNLQMLMLSEFFRCCKRPSRRHKEVLQRWFWVTSLSGWFAGANTTRINDAIEEMRELANDESRVLQVMPLDEASRAFPKSFDMRSARIRALLIFMASLKPRDLSNGKELPMSSLLTQHGNRALVHIFDRLDAPWVSSPGNRLFADRVPGHSVRDRLREIDPKSRRKVLESHAISEDAYRALHENDGEGFVEHRTERLQRLEQEFMQKMGIKAAGQTGFPGEWSEPETDADDEESF